MSRSREIGEAASYLATQGRRNLIINGGFDVWQRGTSFAAGSGQAYQSDRWQIDQSRGGCSRQAFTLGQTEVPNNPIYFLRHSRTTAATASNTGLLQRLEGVNTLAGQTATISFWAKAGAVKTFKLRAVQVFGGGGTPSASVATLFDDINLTTAWQKFVFTITIPSIAGKTLGTDGEDFLQVCFEEVANLSTYTLDIAQVQLEAGDTATPFEQRSYGEELALCQRYYWRLTKPSGSLYFANLYFRGSDRGIWSMVFPVPMRERPVLSHSDLADFSVLYRGTAVSPTNLYFDNASDFGGILNASAPVNTFVQGEAGAIGITNTASGFIALDAEL